ncbi:MAG: 5-(carboxyamino)imidazole ribonucleotide mutase [Defluviitaleaceae bacterium]|nr:5-(carboxyamino)imidazole ribonucleotide mutase [Defluviitaleaceae bacterium]
MQKSVAILMGSDSDWQLLQKAADLLAEFGVGFDARVMSAHRTPEAVREYVSVTAEKLGVKVFIGAAGLAAHLPGVIASLTTRPVIGIPVKSGALSGFDALLSIAQMPPGVAVASVGIDGAVNAALFAIQILASSSEELTKKLSEYRKKMVEGITNKDEALQLSLAADRGVKVG